MEPKDILKKSHDATSKASDLARQFNYAGIGVLWLLISSGEKLKITDFILFLPLLFIILALFIDFLQYFIKGVVWKQFYDKKNNDKMVSIDKKEKWRKQIVFFIIIPSL
jgi:hypothetical protein